VKTAAILAVVAISVFVAPASTRAAMIDFSRQTAGEPAAPFEFWRAGQSDTDHWVASGAIAPGDSSLQEITPDKSEQSSMAIYRAVSAANVRVEIRFKLSGGKLPSAGVAVRVIGPQDYFLIRASAFESRVSLIRVSNGVAEEVVGVEADIEQDHWQSLEVAVQDDEYNIMLDGRWVLTAFDRHPRVSGKIGVWTEQTDSTRFNRIDISPAVAVEN
jgi:hypothetical protein